MTKRRLAHGLTVDEELACWSMLFECGKDFFDEPKPLGLNQQEDSDTIEQEAAWARLGARFLAR